MCLQLMFMGSSSAPDDKTYSAQWIHHDHRIAGDTVTNSELWFWFSSVVISVYCIHSQITQTKPQSVICGKRVTKGLPLKQTLPSQKCAKILFNFFFKSLYNSGEHLLLLIMIFKFTKCRVEIYIVYIFGLFALAVLDFISPPKANSAAASIHYLLKSK